MVFEKEKKEYEVIKEGQGDVLKINAESWTFTPSIEDNNLVMAYVIDKLIEVPSANRVVFVQRRNYVYDYNQVQLLLEIANIYKILTKQKRALSITALGFREELLGYFSSRYMLLQDLIFNLLRNDPIGAYVELKRLIRDEKITQKKLPMDFLEYENRFMELLKSVYNMLEKTKLIDLVKDEIAGYKLEDRSLYKSVFRPAITPDFIFTRLMVQPPLNGEELDIYSVDNIDITIFSIPEDIKPLYHMNPPEFKISEDKYELLDLARTVMAEHKPKEEEFLDPERMRTTFFNIGRDLIQELAEHRNININIEELNDLTNILVRYTVGFGLIELLLKDSKVQDISINGPVGQSPIFIVHEDFSECATNIIPSLDDAESWASKFRILSGRPLDEANPVLDTELIIPGSRARVAIIQKPLNPYGLGFSLRRHRDNPWTFPLFIKNRMMNPLAAGLLSFLIDGARSILFCGTRSSGKTSLLGASLVEIMRKYRIISIEDTLELPTEALRQLGYNIQAMKVRSALTKGGVEVPADEGIRTSLRMGDSSLIVGEIRSSIRGNEEVLIVENGLTKRLQIKDLEGKDISNIYVPSMDFDLKFKLKKLIAFVKHPKRMKLLRVKTRTGREITVTPDHSLFTEKEFKIIPIECQNLRVGSKLVIPEKLPLNYNNIESINLLDLLEDKNCKLVGYEEDLKQVIKKIGWEKATQICNCSNDIYQYLRKGVQHINLSIKNYKALTNEINYNGNNQILKVKRGTSGELSAEIKVTNDFFRFLGYYVAEGYTQNTNGTVVITNSDKLLVEDIVNLSKKLFNIDPEVRVIKGLGVSNQIILRNKILALLLEKLGCGRVSKEKRIPQIIFGLSEEKICSFLGGYFDGDGSQTSVETSGNLIACSTISKDLANDLLYLLLNLGIVARARTKKPKELRENIQYVVEFKQRKYINIFMQKIGFKKYNKKLVSHSTSHSTLNTVSYNKNILEKHVKLKRNYRHLRRYNSCGKDYLKDVVVDAEFASEAIKTFVNGEFYLDEVKSVEEINLDEGEYVYDLSVEPCQNFIGGFGGIMLHNTEAFALYEAMRIGALANVVAGTIHGDSPYGVFDRVVNDLKVPKTSFKATDIIVISNPVRSADGLHKWRRILSITEVRKGWEEDPLKEKGFVDLMKYDPEKDELVPTDDLINGDSDILKSIAGNVKEWSGNWDSLWANILLRTKIKQYIVDYVDKSKMNQILEAPFVIASNDTFHRVSDKVNEEKGRLDYDAIFSEWELWFKKEVKLLS